MTRQLDEYLEADVQRLLTEHADVAEQGITVLRREQTLILVGEVESPARRAEILRRVTERFPDVRLSADIGITGTHPPSEPEELS
jgi:hypothetical protein